MNPQRIWILLLALLLVAAVTPFTGYAQEPTPSDDEVNAIAQDLYCPVCENIPLDACRTPACEQWRGVIRDKLSEGWTEEEIKGYFVDQYGDRVLAEPPKKGFNWLAYLVPPVAFLAGAYLLYQGFMTWRSTDDEWDSPGEGQQDVIEETEDDYISRVEEELQNR